jgi:metallo-beta-lactamase family protein
MPLQIRFHGAANTVTGSCFALVTERAHVLIDCGMFQGSKTEKELNYRPFPFAPSDIDGTILTHAHIDHSGLIPKLTKAGFAGPIFATKATIDLCSVMLPDSGYIQEVEVNQLNRRNLRRGLPEVSPIYTAEDASAALTQFRAVAYKAWVSVAAGVRARYWNAGHLLGSASVEVEVANGAEPPVRILFSGDIGPDHKLLQFDPEAPRGFDYVVCEATYGDTDRQDASPTQRRKLLCTEVRDATKRRGVLLIPSFAVERTQELLVDLVGLMEASEIPNTPIFIDSPLATKASAVFERHAGEMEDGEALRRALNSPWVRFTESVEQSKAIDRIHSFYIVVAASGMCEAGRIRHHLRAWLWRQEATVLLVGYQAQGTLGRILQDGASRVRIMGEDIQVRAQIRRLDVYSGHADGPELEAWLQKRLPIRQDLFLVHGEEQALTGMKSRAATVMQFERVIVPALDDTFDLTAAGARAQRPAPQPRIQPEHVGRRDWHNDLSKLLLDIGETVDRAADDRAKAAVIRRLRRSLGELS